MSTRHSRADLQRCLEGVGSGESLFDLQLEPGRHDHSTRFQLSQRLYGRESEREILLAAFDKACRPEERGAGGGARLLLVAGYSGVGKTSLISEVHKPITERRGYFLAGKHEQDQRNVPYHAAARAFDQLFRSLLLEPASRQDEWRRLILEALGSSAQIIVDVIASLELLIGKQPAVPELGPEAARNRFNLLFSRFAAAICSDEHPLVLFIDDLQWADAASLELLKLLLKNDRIHHFLIIGAYRDNEVDEAHPLAMTLGELRRQGVEVEALALENLSPEAANSLIADSLSRSPIDTEPLARLVYDKTLGNAFFLTQFLRSLYSDGLLTYDAAQRGWVWDLGSIQARGITELTVEEDWRARHAAVVALYVGAAEAAYLTSRYHEMDELCREVLDRAKSMLDKAKVHGIRIRAQAAQGNMLGALRTALAALSQMGLTLPEKPGLPQVASTLLEAMYALRGKSRSELEKLPPMKDPGALAMMHLISSAMPSAYVVAPTLFPMLACKQVILSAQYGNAPASGGAYVLYGGVQCV